MPVHSWSRAARLLLIAALLSDSGRTLAWGDPIRTARPLPAEISNIHAQALIPWVELARRTIFGDNAVRGGRSAGFQSLEKPLVAMTFDSQPADEFRALLFALHAVRGKGLDDGRVKDLENRLQRMMQRLFYQSVPQAEDWEPLREVFERIWPIILPAEFFDNAGGIRNRDDFIRRMEAVPGVASLVDQLVIRTLRAHEDGVIDRWVGDYIFRGGPWQARDPDPEIPYPTDLDYGIRRTLTADDRTGLQAFRRETIREFLRGLFGFITATVPEGGATDWRSDPERAFQAGFDAVAARHGPDDWSALRYGGLVKMQNSPASDPIAETTYAIMGRLQEAQKLYRAGRLLKAMEELDNAIYGNIRIHATGLVAMTQTTLTASLLRSAQAYKQEIDEVYQGWVKDHLDRVQREGADAFSIGWRMADFYLKIARASRPGGPDARQRQIDAAINTFGREMRSVLHPESGTLNPEAVERMYQLVIGMKLALAESNHRAEAAEALKWIEGDVTLLQNGLPDAARYPGDEVLWTAVARSTLASGDGSMLAALLHVPERARSFFHSLTDPIDQDRFMRRMVEAWAAHDDRPVEEIFAAQPKLIGILQGCRSEWERQGLETLVKHADAILAHVAPPPKFREDPAFLAKARARLQWAEELLRRGQTRGAIRAVIPWLVMDMTPSGDQTPAQRLAALDRHPNVDLDQRLDARGIMENAQALFYEAKGVQEQWPLKHLENVAREANPETPGTRTPLATALMLLNYYRQFSDRQKDAALRRLSWRASRLVRKELAIDKVKGYAIFDAVDLFQRLAGADWDLLQGVRGLWPSEIQTRPIRMRDAIRDGVMTGNADVLIQLAGQPEVSDQLFEEARKLWAPEDFKDMMVLLASAYEPARQEAIRSILRRQAGPQRMGLLTFLDDFSEIQRNYKPSISIGQRFDLQLNEIIIWLRDETRQKSMATGDPYVYPLLPGKDAAFEVRSHMIARVRGQDWSFRRFKGQWYYRVTDSKKPYAAMGANFTIGNGESAGPVAVLHFETPYRIHVANEVKDTTLEIRIPAPIPEPSSESTIRANVQTLARWIGTRPQLGESDNYVWVRAVVDPEGRIAHLSALPHDEDVPPARHLDAPLDDGYRIIYCLWSPTGRWTWMAREIRWVIREGGQWREEPVTAHGYPMNFIEAGNRLSQGLKGRNEDQRLLWIANVLPGILAALTVAVIQWWQHPMAWPHAIVWGLSSVVIAMVLHEGWHFIFALNDWLGPRLIGGKSGPAWTGSWPRIRVTQQGIAVRSMTNDAGWRTAERLAGLPFILVIATRPVLRLFGIEFNVLLSDPAVWVPALAINILSLAPLQHIASRLREIHPRWVPTVVHATDGDELLDDFISRNSSGPKGPERSAGVRTQRIFRAAAGRMFRQRLPPQPRCILQAA